MANRSLAPDLTTPPPPAPAPKRRGRPPKAKQADATISALPEDSGARALCSGSRIPEASVYDHIVRASGDEAQPLAPNTVKSLEAIGISVEEKAMIEAGVQALDRGLTLTDAATESGLTRQRLSDLMRSKTLRDEMDRRVIERTQAGSRLIMSLQPKALQIIMDLLVSDSEKIRRGAAAAILKLGLQVGPRIMTVAPGSQQLQIAAGSVVEEAGEAGNSGDGRPAAFDGGLPDLG